MRARRIAGQGSGFLAALLHLLGCLAAAQSAQAQPGSFEEPAAWTADADDDDETSELPDLPPNQAAANVSVLAGWRLEPMPLESQALSYVIPSLVIAEVYDDNIFSEPKGPGRESDFITRFGPAVRAGYASPRLALLAGYAVDFDIYSEHSQLNSYPTRQSAAAHIGYVPTRRMTLQVQGEYRDTRTGRDLNLSGLLDPYSEPQFFGGTNLSAAAVFASEYSASSYVDYQLTSVLDASASYGYDRTEQAGFTNESQAAGFRLNRTLNPRHSVQLSYVFRYFTFGESSPEQSVVNQDVTSNALLLGWRYRLTRLLDVSLQAGPQFSEGEVNAQASASAFYRLDKGWIGLSYNRTQTTAVGESGVIESDTATVGATYQFTPRLGGGASFAFSRNALEGSDANVYQTTVGLVYVLTDWLSITFAHQYAFQDGDLDGTATAAGGGEEDIPENLVLIGLRAIRPYQIELP